MKPTGVMLVLLLVLGCRNEVEPSPVFSSYFLTAVDGHPLPVSFGGDGSTLIASSLAFGDGGRPRGAEQGPVDGTVNYTVVVRRPDQSLEHSTVQLDYSLRGGELRINLCPPLALCIVSTELVGPLTGPTDELVLTNYVGGTPGSVYRYFPSLPD